MDIISYRGPGVAGGVSSGLAAAWRKNPNSMSRWWFLQNSVVSSASSNIEQVAFLALLPESLVTGHYRFCNEFLWPLMHDLPQFASFSESDCSNYIAFNRLLSELIDVECTNQQEFFVQDYQLAAVPRWLAIFGHKAKIFWHIPWPKFIPPEYLEPIKSLVRGILGAETIGFHTQEYAQNFMQFINSHMPEYATDEFSMLIEDSPESLTKTLNAFSHTPHKSYILRQQHAVCKTKSESRTRILVRPLGIDYQHWNEIKESCPAQEQNSKLHEIAGKKFVLSVDRVDYTKAVLDRFLIIDKFFEEFPEWIASITFAQVCGRSRVGLEKFDSYWYQCRALCAAVNSRWQRDNWRPIEWIEPTLNASELAYLYLNARALLVNPIRDGLNLIAKEYVACQDRKPGVLILSPGAGAWHELGNQALPGPADNYRQTLDSLQKALTMPLKDRQLRTLRMKTIIASNSLSKWLDDFEMHVAPELAGHSRLKQFRIS